MVYNINEQACQEALTVIQAGGSTLGPLLGQAKGAMNHEERHSLRLKEHP